MRRLFVILAVLSVLPLAAQTEDDARQFQKLAQVFRYLSGLYVDEVEMKPSSRAPSRACSKSWTPIRPTSARRR